MDSKAKERAELLFHKRQEKRALSEYQAKVQATRELTAKLRAERLAREAMGEPKTDRKPKDYANDHRGRHDSRLGCR